jgi:hypothetical protein
MAGSFSLMAVDCSGGSGYIVADRQQRGNRDQYLSVSDETVLPLVKARDIVLKNLMNEHYGEFGRTFSYINPTDA